jgi:uncharacterized BrkB/YihY/UPF0761 family membrane protein
MNDALVFDLIVGLAFAAAIVIGTLTGFLKLLMMLLAVAAPFAVRILIAKVQGADPFGTLPRDMQVYALAVLGATALALFLAVIWAVPGPATILARVSGVVFALAVTVAAAGAGSVAMSQADPRMGTALLTRSLTGPTALTIGALENELFPFAPNTPKT